MVIPNGGSVFITIIKVTRKTICLVWNTLIFSFSTFSTIINYLDCLIDQATFGRVGLAWKYPLLLPLAIYQYTKYKKWSTNFFLDTADKKNPVN